MNEQLQAEFDKATGYELTDDHIERNKLLLGVDVPNPDDEQIHTASIDSICTFAFDCGNDPLHCGPEYAAGIRWGSVIALNIMAGSINKPLNGGPLDVIRKFNYIGDTQFLDGDAIGKRQEHGLNLVNVKVSMTNRGPGSRCCKASVALPDEVTRQSSCQRSPSDLRRGAASMWARHWELTRSTGWKQQVLESTITGPD